MNKFKAALRGLWERIGLKTWADWRNAIHVITPMLVTLMIYLGLDASVAESFGVFLAAAISPAIAFWNSTSTLRAWIYGLVVPLQGVLVALDVVTQAQYASIMSIVLAAVSAVLASSNTATGPPEGPLAPTIGEKVAEVRHAAKDLDAGARVV